MNDRLKRQIQKMRVMINIAREVSSLSAAKIRQTGCVIIDVNFRCSPAIGYNGQAAGVDHDRSGASLDVPSGDLHAEVNALMKSHHIPGSTMVITTTTPCIPCSGYLLNDPRTRGLVIGDDTVEFEGTSLLKKHGVQIIKASTFNCLNVESESYIGEFFEHMKTARS
jgi:deoxycytidylate deaminase